MKPTIKSILAMGLLVAGTSTLHAQDVVSQPQSLTPQAETKKHCRAWEIGLGGSLINWNRVSFSNFKNNTDSYFHHLRVNHIMGGPNIYVAHELLSWLYVDLQGHMGIAQNNLEQATDAKKANKYNFLYMGGLGLQLRLTPLFEAKYVEPYLRAGVNYLYKDFTTTYKGTFAGDETNKSHWEATDMWNPKGATADKHSFVPLSFGAGVNAWFNNRFGMGLQADYVMPLEKGLPKFFMGSARLMVRFGGEDKRPAPVVQVVEVEKPVEKIVEKIVEVPAAATATAGNADPCKLMENIHFDFDKDLLTAETQSILDEIATLLKNNPSTYWVVTGYTDTRGSVRYNIDLSRRRAKMVYDALLERGVPAEMLKWRGVGKGATAIPYHGKDNVRRGDRKVMLERVTNMDYWNALN